jgi:hypothetical protein
MLPTPLHLPLTSLPPTIVQPAPSPSPVRQVAVVVLSIAGHPTAPVAASLWVSLLRPFQHIILSRLTLGCTHALSTDSMERWEVLI